VWSRNSCGGAVVLSIREAFWTTPPGCTVGVLHVRGRRTLLFLMIPLSMKMIDEFAQGRRNEPSRIDQFLKTFLFGHNTHRSVVCVQIGAARRQDNCRIPPAAVLSGTRPEFRVAIVQHVAR